MSENTSADSRKSKIKWLIVFGMVTAAAIALDQLTKWYIVGHLEQGVALPLIEGVLEFELFHNDGIAWSMLAGQIVFILFTGIVFLAVVLFCVFKLPDKKKFRVLYILAGLLIGGALGNMIDRFRFGYVVDFISFCLIRFPIFNVADMCIVVSIVILAVLFLFVYKEEDLAFLNFKQKKFREIK